jgi:hypothetical protein
MKKIALLLFVACSSLCAWAQAPQMFNYQGVVRNASGVPFATHAISLRLSVHNGVAAGPIAYQETQSTTTNAFGLFNVAVGGGVPTIGIFDTLNWSTGGKFLQVEIDTTGGSAFANLGTSQLLSVPYALNAFSANGTPGYLVKFNSINSGANSALYQNGTRVGIGTTTPTGDLTVASADSIAVLASTTYSASAAKNGVLRAEYNGTLDTDNIAILGTTLTAGTGSRNGYGVEGAGAAAGVFGFGASSNTAAGNQSVGVLAQSYNDEATAGVLALSSSYSGTTSAYNYGIYAETDGSGLVDNYAGYFLGDVYVSGTLSKAAGTFKIDHPLDPDNKYLVHSFVESPDMMNIYNGNVVTNASGEAIVKLPDYFEALNQDFRYQLTVIGTFAQAIVAKEVDHNQFTIKTSAPNVKVSWQVTGIRHDAYANAHRVVPEVEKQAAYKGKYLNPVELGKSKSLQIGGMKAPQPNKQTAKASSLTGQQ